MALTNETALLLSRQLCSNIQIRTVVETAHEDSLYLFLQVGVNATQQKFVALGPLTQVNELNKNVRDYLTLRDLSIRVL